MQTPKTIHILPSLYMIEVTTHSNQHAIKSFCLNCLAKSKTNKEYLQYSNYPSISSVRVCCKCHAMTLEAVITTFDIDRRTIVQLAESKTQRRLKDDTITPMFVIDPTYLNVLKKRVNHG